MRGLPGKLSLLLLLLAALLLGAVGSLEYRARRARLDNELRQTLTVVSDRLETSLSRAVYEFSTATRNIVEAEFPDPSIAAILVWSEGVSWPLIGLERTPQGVREIVQHPTDPGLLTMRRELTIRYTTSAGEGRLPVGAVEVYIDPRVRYQALQREMLLAQAKQTLTVLLLLLALFYVVYRYLMLPLESIRGKMVRLGAATGPAGRDERERLLKVETGVGGFRGFSEIDEMDAAFRQMAVALDSHEAELRASEEKFRTVANWTYDWEYWLAPDGRFLYTSPSCAAVCGYPAAAFEEDPQLLSRLIHPQDRELFEGHMVYCLAPGESALGLERIHFRLLARDGTQRWIEHVCRPVFGSTGEYLGRRASNRDITERKQMEEMLIQSEKMLSVGGLAAGVAHEINNPLAGILQNAQVMRNRLLGDLPANHETARGCGVELAVVQDYLRQREIPRMLDSVSESAERAASIVRNMLNFSRKSVSQPVPADLAELLEQALQLAASDYDLKKKYDFRQIAIARDYASGLPPIECEPTEIQQVFLNIFKNGAQAMAEKGYPPGGVPTFSLRIVPLPEKVRVEIADNGPGMSEEVRRRILEPFFTTKEVGSGTGLGLSICYFIVVEHHGGTLEVFSEVEEGTRFVITLPCRMTDAVTLSHPSP